MTDLGFTKDIPGVFKAGDILSNATKKEIDTWTKCPGVKIIQEKKQIQPETEIKQEIPVETKKIEPEIPKENIQDIPVIIDHHRCYFEKTDRGIRLDILNQYEVFEKNDKGERTGHINCVRLAKLILESDGGNYLVTKDNQEIFSYNGSYYEPCGDAIIKERVQYYLDDDVRGLEHYKKEVCGYIRNNAYVDREVFNPPLHLINLKNGILDLETKELQQHTPDHFFLQEIPVIYDKNADCPIFKKFLKDVLYKEDIDFIQEFTGYCLYRRYTWAILIILLGHGRNGKTTFINTLTKLLGEKNVKNLPLQTLATQPFSLSQLYGKLANLCSDIGEQEIKKTELIKQLTGNDTIAARNLYKPYFEFMNIAKLVFACNTLPTCKDETLAMKERFAIIEFPNQFPRDREECDPYIIEKLTTDTELSGILNWAIDGLQRLQKKKTFSKYRDLDDITKYLSENKNPIKQFVDRYIDPILHPDEEVQKNTIYQAYLAFARTNNHPTMFSNHFSQQFKMFAPHGMEEGQSRSLGRKKVWKGIKIKCGNVKELQENHQEKIICSTEEGVNDVND